MCLITSTIKPIAPENSSGFGYQVVQKDSRGYRGFIITEYRAPIGQWETAVVKCSPWADSPEHYECGFHILTEPHTPAQEWDAILVKVEYRGAHTKGISRPCRFITEDGETYDNVETIVASECRIIEEVFPNG